MRICTGRVWKILHRHKLGIEIKRPKTPVTRREKHVYEVRPRKDKRGFDLINDALPFGRLWYGEPNAIKNAVGYAKFYSRSHDAVIRVFDWALQPCYRVAHARSKAKSPIAIDHRLSRIHR